MEFLRSIVMGWRAGPWVQVLWGACVTYQLKKKKILDHLSISCVLYIIFMDYAEVYVFAVCNRYIIIHLD